MKSERQYRGFSLTEVLLAVGTFAIGMIFVAGVFPVAIHFTTVATERTIAAVVTDEAFAKIRLYGIVDFNSPLWPLDPTIACVDFNDVSFVNQSEFAYPSTSTLSEKNYYWSALCRRVDVSNVQVTVFTSRKIGAGTRYWDRNPDDTLTTVIDPIPVQVGISNVPGMGNENKLSINDAVPIDFVEERTFINDGYTIVDNETGDIYRVRERYADMPDMIELDRPWQGGPTGSVWVIPPPIGGGRYPCVAIYQRVIRF